MRTLTILAFAAFIAAVPTFVAAQPKHPQRMLPAYDNGDHLHPSDAGLVRVGDFIDLALFD